VSDWSVECEAPGPRRHDEALADELIESMEGYGPAVAVGRGSIVVRFDVKAVSARHAFEKGYEVLARACPEIRPSRFTVESVDALERELERTDAPELLGVAEVATALRVSRQRVAQLQHRADFPSPDVRLRGGPIWRRATLAHFLASWSRTSGRPALNR
jgi:hypothetical protein